MIYTYEEITMPNGEIIIRRSDGASIPSDPSNADYQAYLNKDNPDYGKPTQL